MTRREVSDEVASPGKPAAPPRSAARRSGDGRWGLLARRDFRLLWIGETTSKLGTSITTVALPLVAVVTLRADTLMVGVLTAATWLPWVIVGLPAGAWVDRLSRRPVMIVCNLVSMLLFASVPLAAWAGVLTLAQLLAVALLGGTASVFFFTAYRVYVTALIAKEELVEGNAKLQGSESVAQIAGPGVAGLIAQAFGAVTGLLADAVSFLISTVCLLSIRTREPWPAGHRQGEKLRRQIGVGLRFVGRDPYLRSLTAFGATANLALTGYQAIQVVFLVRTIGVGSGTAGGLIACASFGGVLGAIAAPPICRRFGTARGVLLCQLCAAPFGLLIPLAGPGNRLILFVAGTLPIVAGATVCNIVLGSFCCTTIASTSPRSSPEINRSSAHSAVCPEAVSAAIAWP